MTGKVLNQGVSSALVLILPIALIVVLVLKAWLYLLLLFGFLTLLNLWQSYRWQQQCQQVDPFFYALIKEHQGYLTPIDLAVKANLSATTAEKFLAKKAQEYGAQSKKVNHKVAGYYFLTANALKSIFEESDPLPESLALTTTPDLSLPKEQITSNSTQQELIPDSPVGEEKITPESTQQELIPDSPVGEEKMTPESTQQELIPDSPVGEEKITPGGTEDEDQTEKKLHPLTQIELAKRLNTTSSMIRKKRELADFPNWSKSRDPQGISWRFSTLDNSSKNIIFEPIINSSEEE